MAVLIATGVKRSGEREVMGVDVGTAEDLEFWRSFLRQLVSRSLVDQLAGAPQQGGQPALRRGRHLP
jgi:transposase-like protein